MENIEGKWHLGHCNPDFYLYPLPPSIPVALNNGELLVCVAVNLLTAMVWKYLIIINHVFWSNLKLISKRATMWFLYFPTVGFQSLKNKQKHLD